MNRIGHRLLGSTTVALLISTAAALAVGAVLIIAVGVDPRDAYRTMLSGSVGSWDVAAQTSLRMAPLLAMALGLIPALRAGIFTIGSEGQFGIGALVAGLVTLEVAGHVPSWLALLCAAVAGMIGGGAWALLPALLRAFLGVDEILTTFAFNFIAVALLLWLLNGPARGEGQYLVQTSPMPEETWLPTFGNSVAHAGLLLLPLIVLGVALFGRTSAGYRVRLFGQQESLALSARARPRRIVVSTMLVGGAAAGLAGWVQIAGVDRAVFASVFRGYGYLALALVALGGARVVPTIVGALLFAMLQTGSEAMQLGVGVSADLVFVMQGLALFLMSFRLVGGAER